MRRILALAAITTLASAPVLAQEAAPRFAIFAPDQLFKNSARAKKVVEQLDGIGKGLQEKLVAKQKELEKMAEQLKSPGLSDEGRATLTRNLQDGETAFKRAQEDSQKEFNKESDKIYGQFQKEVGPIVEEVSRERKLQVVFQYTRQNAGMFAFTDEKWAVEFTDEIAKRYDAKFAGKSAAPEADAPVAKPAAKAAPKAKKNG
ncbi:MAG: OmpH family outer membrane protein [Holophagaceae bacterium]|nr:OmpH family outer membrane protein [Holophagaceae bacterium]